MSQYPNWFAHYADQYFERHLSHLSGKPGLNFLQIGAFTGDASAWLLEHILTGKGSFLVDVDTWEGSDEPEHEAFDWADVKRTYCAQTQPYRFPFRLRTNTETSADFFRAAEWWDYDFIYIDGDHTAAGVLSDAVAAYRCLKVGGLLAFDDYQWKPYPDAPLSECPGPAIDAFIACYGDKAQVLEVGLQVWLRKLS